MTLKIYRAFAANTFELVEIELLASGGIEGRQASTFSAKLCTVSNLLFTHQRKNLYEGSPFAKFYNWDKDSVKA